MTFDTRGELAKLREESTFIDDLKENLGIEPKVNLQELFTHWIYRSPGISTRHLVGKAPSSRHGAAYGLLKLWSDPEKGPFHRHPGRGNSIRHFPGPCSPDCQGAKR